MAAAGIHSKVTACIILLRSASNPAVLTELRILWYRSEAMALFRAGARIQTGSGWWLGACSVSDSLQVCQEQLKCMATLAYETVCSAPKEAGSGDRDKQTALIVHGLLGSGYSPLLCHLVFKTVSWDSVCRIVSARNATQSPDGRHCIGAGEIGGLSPACLPMKQHP